MLRWCGQAAVSVLLASLVGLSMPGVAVACACGGVATSPNGSASIADEEALVTTAGGTETIVMRLNLKSSGNDAGLIVPTPTPATVTTTSPSLFDELASLSAPRIETRRHWRFGFGMAGSAAPAAEAPTVLRQVQLGPLEATTLTGGDVSGVQQWLDSHGYTMRPEVVARLDPYLSEGWAFVAMRLTSTDQLNGRLAPVKLVFASDRLVYPMRMSAAAQTSQRVVVYTLGEHRMQRTDPDAAAQRVEVDYAGSVAGRAHDPTLTELAGHGAFLTKISVDISDPSAITSDFEFGRAPNDDAFQQVVYRDRSVDVTPFVFFGGLLLVFVVAVAVGIFFAVRTGRRQRT
jgi:hypothetical protein